MRIYFPLSTLAAVAVMTAMSSCNPMVNNDATMTSGLKNLSDIQFAEYSDTAVMDMPEMAKIAGKPAYGTIIASGVFPIRIGDTDITPLQNAILSAAYGTQNCPIAQAIKYYNTHPALVEQGDSLKPATLPLQRDSVASEQYSVVSVQTMTNSLLSFAIFQYIYPYGAAHGMSGTSYINYYIPTNELITADNMFDSASRNMIINVIRDAAKEQYASTDTMVDPEEIETFDNFYVSPSGMTFVYSPYEIAPYAAGEVSVSVAPYYLYDYLTPFGKTIFGF